MKILTDKKTGNGIPICGECLMLDREGTIYECIDSKYHPNPGNERNDYSGIERTIDWLYRNHIRSIQNRLDQWVAASVAFLVEFGAAPSLKEAVFYTMYPDSYTPCDAVVSAIKRPYEECIDAENDIFWEYLEYDESAIDKVIATFLNENFLRVRAGGKYKPQGTNSLYFRISSHGYDWYDVIMNFMRDIFGIPENMPEYIWIGHDKETNPPEVVLFEGTPFDLFRSERYGNQSHKYV